MPDVLEPRPWLLSDFIFARIERDSERDSVVFSHPIDEYGSHGNVPHKLEAVRENINQWTLFSNEDELDGRMLDTALIQAEERVTGSVPWSTYTKYFRFAGHIF